MLVDIPKDVQFATAAYLPPAEARVSHYQPRTKGDPDAILAAVEALEKAERPILYSGGGVINSGPEATRLLRALADETGFPLTSTLMGLGAYPASGRSWVGMLGMHGTYEANWAMHDCDVMLCIGARFDDRITGRLDAFSPGSLRVHIDIDPSSINKNIHVHVPIVGDVAAVLGEMLALWRERGARTAAAAVAKWWKQIELWRGRNCLAYRNSDTTIKPQYALQRLEALTLGRDRYITTEVGQHQMWAAQYLTFEEPNRWMTSGGLGTMGYGFPASIGVQVAHPQALVINVAGEASWLMNMQEMGTAVQYRLPVKQFILNNERLGMVRQWQELLHGERYSSSWSEALPDFVKLAEAFGAKGILGHRPGEARRRDHGDDRASRPGHRRRRRREARELLPDDPVGQGAQRDAARRGRHLRRDRRRRRGPGLRRDVPWSGRPSSSTRRSSSTSKPAWRGPSSWSPRPPTPAQGSWSSPRHGCPATRPGSGGCAPARTWPWRTSCTAPSPPMPSTSAATACARSATPPASAASSSSPGFNEIDRAASSTLFNSARSSTPTAASPTATAS